MKRPWIVIVAASVAACGGKDAPVGPVPPIGCVPAVQVNPSTVSAQSAPTALSTQSTSLSMSAGSVRVLTGGSAIGCVEFTAADSSSQYLLVAANAAATPDIVTGMNVSWQTGVATVADRMSYSVLGASSPSSGSLASTVFPRVDDAFENRLRAYERATLRLSVARAAYQRAQFSVAGGIPAPTTVARTVNVGDTLSFHVPGATNLCTNFVTVKATVKAIGANSIIVQDVTSPAGGFSPADFTSLAQEFDAYIFPTDTTYFGHPSDIDGNGKVYILFTPQVNKLTPRTSTSFVGGFFWAGDLFPNTGTNSCAESNQGEIFYMLVPDSAGVYSAPRTAGFVRQVSRGTLGHEFQHMINAGTRLFVSSAPSWEATWLDEALAHFAEDAVGRAEDGFSQTADLTFSQVIANNNDFNAFYYQNLARLKDWLVRPDTSSATSSRADKGLAYRGAAWALLRYTADQYSGGNVPAFTRRVVAGPDTSTGNLSSKAGVPFDSLMAGWLVAMYVDDNPAPSLARYQLTSWNIRDAEAGLNSGAYPLMVGTLPPDSLSAAYSLRSATGVYFLTTGPGAGRAAAFRLLAPGGGALAAPGARLYIVRLN